MVIVILPCDLTRAEQHADACLRGAASGWPMPFHARDCVDPRRRVHDAVALASIRALATSRLGDASRDGVDRLGALTLRAVREACHTLLEDLGGHVLVCGEHDAPPHDPPAGSWSRMMDAAVDEAILMVALDAARRGARHAVDLRVAERDPGYEYVWSPERLRGRAAWVGVRSCVVEPAARVAGLQLADVFAHALGPRTADSTPLANAATMTLASRRHTYRQIFLGGGPVDPSWDASVRGAGALEATHGRVMRALCQGDSDAAEELRQAHRPLPPCTLPYALQGSLETVGMGSP